MQEKERKQIMFKQEYLTKEELFTEIENLEKKEFYGDISIKFKAGKMLPISEIRETKNLKNRSQNDK